LKIVVQRSDMQPAGSSRYATSAVGAGDAGDASATSRKFFFVQNLGKIGQSLRKIWANLPIFRQK